MATFQTFQEVGIKEDVSDVISNISPRKTPFLSSIGNEKVTQPLFQWQEDSLRAVNGTNASPAGQVEGADVTYITVNPTVMRQNYTQIFTEAVAVSGTVQVTKAHGRSKELAYQMAKSAAQLKRDLENALVGTAQNSAVGSSSVARAMAGYQHQISAANISYMGASTNLSEAALVNSIQAAYTAGSEPSRIMVTPANSIVIAAFASAAGRYRTIPNEVKGANGTIVNAVNIYVSPFGEQKVELNRFLRVSNTLIFEPDMWSLMTLRPWTRESLAKTGDSEKQMLVGEFSLKHKNFLASTVIVDNNANTDTTF